MADLPPVRHDAEARRFEIQLDGATAYADYNRLHDALVFTHTEVPDQFGGRGVASKLARTALDYARSEGLKVKPVCPFFASYIQKHPEYQDLVHASWREKLGLAPA